ncbi:MAG: fumarylacetoacetate hydrolase family protein [Blastocatellia bacterium]|nr:fumarylacetoacetate hydrolase family protein [Blastocatellia bacterium]MCS7158586.1 fumarylacetoacetate hydrolase family protein [Blastocatellia bacterium]MDW8169288.1 fumarylacetoacetate hydrolase family protein [Acidobacteriota bacterium]MDW8257782.1 fumarylacetoacetate hydrolase family protein [Acidobacteriota bacterium]
MRLASYVWREKEQVGIVVGEWVYSLSVRDPQLRDVGALLERGEEVLLQARRLEMAIREGERGVPHEAMAPLSEVRLLPPVRRPEKIICLGLNYRDHAREAGMPIPAEPVFFAKYANTLAGPYDPILRPLAVEQLDYEVELAVVIGREGKYLSEAEALAYVAGYMVLNDVSARDFQFRTGQWTHGKTFDGFAPCGPFLVTADEVPDPHGLRLRLWVNGELRQDSHTGEMIFSIPYLIHYFSQLFTLRPGDILSTGTPPGVGMARRPPAFLKDGDEVVAWIEGIGQLCNRVVMETLTQDGPPPCDARIDAEHLDLSKDH